MYKLCYYKIGKDKLNYQNGGVVKRGGNWDNTTAAGVFARNNNWATNGNTNIGARFARYLFRGTILDLARLSAVTTADTAPQRYGCLLPSFRP